MNQRVKTYLHLLLSMMLCVYITSCSMDSTPSEIKINPVPQSMELGKGTVSTDKGYKAGKMASELSDVLGFVKNNDGAVVLNIAFGADIATNAQIPAVSGAYKLSVSKEAGVNIVGYDERGAYYGIQTLLQLNSENKLPVIEILDYPDIPYRGVVEGFYGNPWTHRARLSLIDFYGKFKMNAYLYGPKDDPYHSSLSKKMPGHADNAGWRVPYPPKEAAQIKELVDASNRNRLDFVWAIHPGQDIKWTEDDYQKLKSKFEQMYDLGVRAYAIFFDDISGEGTKATKQAELLNRINKEFITAKGDVSPLVMCPTDYTKLWADPAPTGYLSILGRELDPSINVMWTGDVICGDIYMGTLDWVNSRIKRPTYIWWNYPVTDYVKHIMLQGPVYGLGKDITKDDMVGFVSNPMEHAEASKLALYSVANYTWNVADYNHMASWENALKELLPSAYDAYRTFAIHSTDTETGYRRDESFETNTFSLNSYTKGQYDSLKVEFEKVKAAPQTLYACTDNTYLIEELRPWLVEFEKLGQRGLNVLDLISLYENNEDAKFWELYNSTIITPQDIEEYNKHKSGTLKLYPFIKRTRDDLAAAFYSRLSEKPFIKVKPMASFSNVSTLLGELMLDGDIKTYYNSAAGQRAGSWVGVDLGEVTEIKHVMIRQGRNRPNDVDYFDDARIEVSNDAKEWTVIKNDIKGVYDIDFRFEDVKARYVRLARNDASKRTNWMTVRRFEINPQSSDAAIYTNVARLQNHVVSTSGNKISIKPMFETINLAPQQYVGIKFPTLTTIAQANINLGNKNIAVEYSSDGKTWSSKANVALFVRGINKGTKAEAIKVNKFEFATLSSGGDKLAKMMDKDVNTSVQVAETISIAVPSNAKNIVVLSPSANKQIKLVQISNDGNKISEDNIASGVGTLALKQGVVRIEILPEVQINEIVFK